MSSGIWHHFDWGVATDILVEIAASFFLGKTAQALIMETSFLKTSVTI
jgi:hypothetical protein